MATVTHYIRSHYDPDEHRDLLLRETCQIPDTPATTAHSADQQRQESDPWETESSSFGPRRTASAPSFVPAVVSYEELNEVIGMGSSRSSEVTPRSGETKKSEISGWYKSLRRRKASNIEAPSSPHSLSSSSSLPLPSASNAGTSASHSLSERAKQADHHRTAKNWFISNALDLSTSSSPSPTPSTLSDILDRDPPSDKPHVPPVWIAIDPTNRGFTMLQNSGWSEGEPLGSSIVRRSDRAQPPPPARKKIGKKNRAHQVREEEEEITIQCEGYDDVAEVLMKTREIVDLTLSDSDSDDFEIESVVNEPLVSGPSLLDHGGKALLTPLPTVLKSDRLGIGLKAKTSGPYKASQKRVTHNAAALAAHIKANEDMRRLKARVGRGSRGLAKISKREAANRRNLLAYLKE